MRERFLEGLDDIGITLRTEDAITTFEAHAARLAAHRLDRSRYSDGQLGVVEPGARTGRRAPGR